MSRDHDAVLAAIERWQSTSTIDADTAARLRAVENAYAEASSSRTSQYVLAITGSIVLLIAGGVFLSWAWPQLGDLGRTLVLIAGGAVATGVGLRLEGEDLRWRPTSYALQIAGMGLFFFAYGFSEDVWRDQSMAATVFGIILLTIPIVLAPRAMRRDPVMPAVHLAVGLAFLAIFLARSTPLSEDAVIWVLDAVLLGAVLVLSRLLRTDLDGRRHPWVLNAFITAMGIGFVLVALTAAGPLSLTDGTWLAMDVWWALSLGLTVWGLERGGPLFERPAFERLLALQVVGWIVLGLGTAHETFDGGPALGTLMVSGFAVLAFLYSDPRRLDSVMLSSAVAFVIPIWWWAIDAAGALGGIAALVGTAALLFWAAGRRGSAEAT